MAEKWIYWLRELGAEHNNIVGKKCANLGEMTKAGFHVPPGFALGVDAYDRFMKETVVTDRLLAFLKTFKADANKVADTLKFEAASNEMRKIVESIKMPPDMEETVKNYYAELCKETGKKNLFVATRSAGPASHPGQYETYLNVSGAEDVVQNVIRVWSSTFNARSVIARARLGLPLHYDPIGVAVLTMVDAKAAGVMFTVNPVNGDESKIAIEASFGFGEAVVSGNVTPDRYLIDKITYEIDEKVISDKAAEFAYNPSDQGNGVQGTACRHEKAALPRRQGNHRTHQIAKKVQDHFGCPQDIEYSISGSLSFPESIFLVQARPESVWGKKKKESVLGKKSGWDLLLEKATTPVKLKIS